MKKISNFLYEYNKSFLKLATLDNLLKTQLVSLLKLVKQIKKKNKKIIIVGNGGSAAIASHFSVDMTKVGGVRSINFNESDLLTCFANDYGYENWVKQALKFYADDGDLVILISASGNSKNMINAAKYINKSKKMLITLTGFNGKNLLSKYGKINFIVRSTNYNIIENIHQYWLLLLIDLMVKLKKN